VLYGVTMEEQGVSKIVSVKFHKVEEGAGERPGRLLVPLTSVTQVEEEEDAPHEREDTLEVALVK